MSGLRETGSTAARPEASQALSRQDLREALFAEHIDFAKRLAARQRRRYGAADIELEDLFQLAAAGLLEAIDRFDPERGVPFRAYASRRITGSILNGLAKSNEMREQISFRNRVRSERLRSLSPTAQADPDAVDAITALADMAVGLALGFLMEAGGLVASADTPDPRPNAYDSLAWKELLRRLSAEVEALGERERLIIRGHYFQGLDFERLALLLGVSKGRVSQLHRTALVKLAKGMSSQPKFLLKR